MMTPARFACARARSRSCWTSAATATPPLAMTLQSTAVQTAVTALKFGPVNVPSVAISVKMIVRTPSRLICVANSTAARAVFSTQPLTATKPSRASIPTAIWSPNSFTKVLIKSGDSHAFVPTTTRLTPIAKASAICWRVRSPPPSWTGICTVPRMVRTLSQLRGSPPNAPSRSTTCSHWAPCSAHRRAPAAGSLP